MRFEDDLRSHLNTKAMELDVPKAVLTTYAHNAKPSRWLTVSLSSAVAGLAIIAFGLLLTSGSSTNTQEGDLPNLPNVADLNPTLTPRNSSPLIPTFPTLSNFTWHSFPFDGATFIEFGGAVIAVGEFDQIAISEDGATLPPPFDATAQRWDLFATDGETLFVISEPAITGEPWLILTSAGDGAWTENPIQFPEASGPRLVRLVGAVDGQIYVQVWEDDIKRRDAALREQLPIEYQSPELQYALRENGVFVLEPETGLQLGYVPSDQLPDRSAWQDWAVVNPDLDIGLAAISPDGSAKMLNPPMADMDLGPRSTESNVLVLHDTALSTHFSRDGLTWTKLSDTWNTPRFFEGNGYYVSSVHGLSQFTDNFWAQIGPNISPPALPRVFDVGDLGIAVAYSHSSPVLRSPPIEYSFTLNGASLRNSLALRELVIDVGGKIERFARCCDESYPNDKVSLRNGSLVFSGGDTELLVVDPNTLQEHMNAWQESEPNDIQYLYYSSDENQWGIVDMAQIENMRNFRDIMVTESNILIATDQEILVGTPR